MTEEQNLPEDSASKGEPGPGAGKPVNQKSPNQPDDGLKGRLHRLVTEYGKILEIIQVIFATFSSIAAIILFLREFRLLAGIILALTGVILAITANILSRWRKPARVGASLFSLGLFVIGMWFVTEPPITDPPTPTPPIPATQVSLATNTSSFAQSELPTRAPLSTDMPAPSGLAEVSTRAPLSTDTPAPTELPAPRYDFEESTQGWRYQVYIDTMGVTNVMPNCDQAYHGKCSLQLTLDLKGLDPSQSKGEAWVDLRSNPPPEIEPPVDLGGKTLSCWVRIEDQDIEGDPKAPNGIQLFAKSLRITADGAETWSSEYGSWENLVSHTGYWFPVKLSPSAPALPTPYGSYRDEGFERQQVVIIGVKIATNSLASAAYTYQGNSIFIDACDWQ